MEKFLIDILNKHAQKYNNLTIESNLDFVKRGAFLNAIEGYHSLRDLDDEELRDELMVIAQTIRSLMEKQNKDSTQHFELSCHLQYWFELTDELKKVRIIGE